LLSNTLFQLVYLVNSGEDFLIRVDVPLPATKRHVCEEAVGAVYEQQQPTGTNLGSALSPFVRRYGIAWRDNDAAAFTARSFLLHYRSAVFAEAATDSAN